jgi:hypothetical protein
LIATSPAGVGLLLIQKIIDEQFEVAGAEQINAGGGGKTVFRAALNLLTRVFPS